MFGLLFFSQNLNKQHFFSFGVPWSFLGLSLVFSPREIGKEQREGILIKSIIRYAPNRFANSRWSQTLG